MTAPVETGKEGGAGSLLAEKLGAVLPKGYRFGVHHLSTPPFRTESLCSSPPDARPDRTYCENHFLAVTINPDHSKRTPQSLRAASLSPRHGDGETANDQVLVLAVEIFIFTTAYSSTFFVSKADSTGYLHLLGLPSGTPSPIREVSAAFISYLVEHRRRNDVQSVVSLFARSQAQYLFPGSIENSGKHVLDDRGLVRWWCRVLDPLLEVHTSSSLNQKSPWANITGYLVIPGLDAYESRAFLPRTPSTASRWVLGHPLEKISHFVREYDWVPPRCLIPRYPDDPKSRFRDELDTEASHWTEYQEKGSWRSVKTLEQFWEMMAFRQECSGGHMTGFIWVVFDPPGTASPPSPKQPPLLTPSTSFDGSQQLSLPSTPPRRRAGVSSVTPKSSPLKPSTASDSVERTPTKQSPVKSAAAAIKPKKKRVLKGSIRARQPRVKTHAKNYLPDIPTSTAYYTWPTEGRGTRIVTEADYKRSVELLLRLDFANLHLATGSTKRWISEVGGGMHWGLDIVGRKSTLAARLAASSGRAEVNNMTNLVRKKRPAEAELAKDIPNTASGAQEQGVSETAQPSSGQSRSTTMADGGSSGVNVLSASLVRKKRKGDESQPTSGDQTGAGGGAGGADNLGQQVNVLGAGLVRKKPKAA